MSLRKIMLGLGDNIEDQSQPHNPWQTCVLAANLACQLLHGWYPLLLRLRSRVDTWGRSLHGLDLRGRFTTHHHATSDGLQPTNNGLPPPKRETKRSAPSAVPDHLPVGSACEIKPNGTTESNAQSIWRETIC